MKWDTKLILKDIQGRKDWFTASDIAENVPLKPNHIGKIITARLTKYVKVIGMERVGQNSNGRKIYEVIEYW